MKQFALGEINVYHSFKIKIYTLPSGTFLYVIIVYIMKKYVTKIFDEEDST